MYLPEHVRAGLKLESQQKWTLGYFLKFYMYISDGISPTDLLVKTVRQNSVVQEVVKKISTVKVSIAL